MERAIVVGLAKLDDGIDALVYRPAVVKMFVWLPRWWTCGLAKLSCQLDDRWRVGYWGQEGRPGPLCDVCGRRASWLQIGGDDDADVDDPNEAGLLADRVLHLCGWCRLDGPINNADELASALAAARDASVSWRWRWYVEQRATAV